MSRTDIKNKIFDDLGPHALICLINSSPPKETKSVLTQSSNLIESAITFAFDVQIQCATCWKSCAY